jgi:hypothetical protein
MSAPLESEQVAQRLEALRRSYVPVSSEEAWAWMEGEDASEARGAGASSTSRFAEAVQGRLDELRALCELTEYLHASRPR